MTADNLIKLSKNKPLLENIANAVTFIGQAQELVDINLDEKLWKELGNLYDEVAGLKEYIEEGDFD